MSIIDEVGATGAWTIDPALQICSPEHGAHTAVQDALKSLSKAIREVEAVLEAMRVEHDPLASHIFVSRRQYQARSDTKSGKRGEVSSRLSWQTACNLGFRGTLDEWERLMGAVPTR